MSAFDFPPIVLDPFLGGSGPLSVDFPGAFVCSQFTIAVSSAGSWKFSQELLDSGKNDS